MESGLDLMAVRTAAAAVLGPDHHAVRMIDLAIATGDGTTRASASFAVRRLPPAELSAIIALAECPTWQRRQAKAALGPRS